MANPDTLPTFESLSAKMSASRVDFPNDVWLRIYRALSWLSRADMESDSDPDAKFIFYWIAFNAAYGRDLPDDDYHHSEVEGFMDFFDRVTLVDSRRKTIHRYVFSIIPKTIESLVANKFVFRDFWKHYNGDPRFNKWEMRLRESEEHTQFQMERGDTARVLATVFGRLYVLRNQLVHGGATWKSSVNRDQVNDGVSIMAYTVPVFIDLMMDNSGIFDDGRPYYPLVGKPSGPQHLNDRFTTAMPVSSQPTSTL